MHDSGTVCLIGLGGNVGLVERTIGEALEMMDSAGCRVISHSEYYQSVPMGVAAGGTFINTAALLTTHLGPLQFLRLMQDVERRCGRERTHCWGPRTLDLDLLFYGQQVINSEPLTVPHPGLWYRRFVLDPLLEISPEWNHPVYALTVHQLRVRLDQRPLIIDVNGQVKLPRLPNRYPVGVVEIRRGGSSVIETSSVRERFCSLRVIDGQQSIPTTVASEEPGFEVPVCEADVAQMFEAILSAALGY